MTEIFHPSCGRTHPAEVSLDATGFPVTTWLEPCPLAVLDRLVTDAGRLLAIAVDSGHYELAAEALEAVLELNDEPEAEP